jgi:hypothetical protein
MGAGDGELIPKVPKAYDSPDNPTHIDANEWTLYDKITYGGLGYGAFALPSNFFIIIATCIFPPLGQIINVLGNTILPTPPFFTIDALRNLVLPDNFISIIYSFILTSLFYVPGLVYVLGNIVDKENIEILNLYKPDATLPATTEPATTRPA